MDSDDLKKEISRLMPYEEFLRIQDRIAELKRDEEQKLLALAQLQQAYLSAASEKEIEIVRKTVAQIREISRAARQEIRGLTLELQKFMSIEQARDYYSKILKSERSESQSPK